MRLSKAITVLAYALFFAAAAFAGQRTANAYKTHKLTTNSVMISCNDEREPKVSHWENTTLIIVSCQTPAQEKLDRELDRELKVSPQR
jgi:hypothetical protein